MNLFQKTLLPTLAAIAAVGILPSCSDDNPWDQKEGEGKVNLFLEPSADVKSAIPQITRASAPDVPDASEFAITMARIDGSWSKDYASLAEFNAAGSFKTGAYILSATYGSLNDEGFEKPCYKGETHLTILEERTTDATVTATLASAMVSITYTDAFKQYFTDWSATVHTEGHSYIDFEKTETRPAYIAPGNTQISINVTDHDNRTVNLSPCSFASLERNHYKITFDVNQGQVGIAQLTVTFDDSLTREDVVIDLTDDLYVVAAPSITPSGFVSGDTFEIVKGEQAPARLSMTVNAPGRLKSAILTFDSETYTPPFGNETELVNAPQNVQSAMGAMGIDARGFFRNPEEMAWIDLTDLPAFLPAGRHTITLLAKDETDRASEPISVTFDISPVEISAAAPSAVLGADTAIINVQYNGSNPKEDISFQVMNDLGQYHEARVISMTESPTRSISAKSYNFEIELPESERETLPVKVFVKGVEVQQLSISFSIPRYSLQADAFATYALLKVVPENPADLATITTKAKVMVSGAAASEVTMSRDASKGIIMLFGLNPERAYKAITSLTTDGSTTDISFTTESAPQLPNSNFATTAKLKFASIDAGGKYKYGATTMQNKSSIDLNVPAGGWATLNPLTAYSGSNPMNTWFVVPSTFMEGDWAVIRSVAYSHNGTMPALDNHGLSVRAKYSRNAPASISDKTAGELFLGEYSFNGTASRTDGASFSSRPTSLSFDYIYTPDGDEKAKVEFTILDASGSTLATATKDLGSQSSAKTETINLSGYAFGKKASSVKVRFLSSSSANVNITIPKDLADVTNTTSLSGQTIAANQYKSLATGSVLKVSGLRLSYESPSAAANAKKRKNRKSR